MKHRNRFPALAAFFLASLFHFPLSLADEGDVTTAELATVLGFHYITITLPGDHDDIYDVGPIMEFGDGSNPVSGGLAGPVHGGSVLKFFVRWKDDGYHCSILSGAGALSGGVLPKPYENTFMMASRGQHDYQDDLYLIKVAKRDAIDSISSDGSLKEGEFGVRLVAKKRDGVED